MESADPQIRSIADDAGRMLVGLVANERLDCFQGHFPGCPLLPGVVQIQWAIELGRAHLSIRGAFRELRGLKFMRVIQPGAALTLELQSDAAGSELKFAYSTDGRLCSRGVVCFEAAS